MPLWVLDLTGSIAVVISLYYLFYKRPAYWHWSNASVLPYFALFATTGQYLLAGLQACYLVFGVHGLALWWLERRRESAGTAFNERAWYLAPWALSAGIFAYSCYVTEFTDAWAWTQFGITSAALVANVGTTRKWQWSWYLWVAVNAASAVYFWHMALYAQFGLQFLLAGMSVYGARVWARERPRVTSLYGQSLGDDVARSWR